MSTGCPGASGPRRRFVVGSTARSRPASTARRCTLEPPLRFTVHAGVLRVRIAPHHPGASPAAALPEGLWAGIRAMLRIVAGDPPRR